MKNTTKMDNRRYPSSPISCVGVVVYNNEKILLVKRAKEPSKGMWSIPGGAIELGETIYAAAAREVREECSIEIKIERILDAVENIVRNGSGRIQYHYIITDLLAKYVRGVLKAGTDAAECGWFTPEEMLTMDITPTLRAMFLRHGIIKNIS